MKSLNWLFNVIFIGYVYAQHNTLHPHNVDDTLKNHAANRLINMTNELVIEAKLLQRQMQPVQKFYQGQVTYEIGYVMGKIRDRYKHMIEIYKQAHYMTKHLYLDDKNISQLNTTIALKPGIKMYYPINWIINMEYMRLFEVDIDKLVEVLENIPSNVLPDIGNPVASGGSFGNNKQQVPPGGFSAKQPNSPPVNPPGGSSGPKAGPPGTKLTRTGGQGSPSGAGLLRSGPPNVPNELPTSFANQLPPNIPNEPPLGPPSQPYEPSLDEFNEPSLDEFNEPPPNSAGQSYEPGPGLYNEPPLGLYNEPPPDSATQFYEAPQTQSFDSPGQSYEPPPGQPKESPPSPPSWTIEPPAASYGKVIRFGSADTNFHTEGELKEYYRQLYREKHDGMNDKFDNLYK